MSAVYDFATQLEKGQSAERLLDAHFAEWFDIKNASSDEQRRGIDRWFVGKATGQRIPVEYKADWKAARTHTAFIETLSVVPAARSQYATRKGGWAYTSEARWLIYFCPGAGAEVVYMAKMSAIRDCLPHWLKVWPEKEVQNSRYSSWGVIVPLREMERVSFRVVSL